MQISGFNKTVASDAIGTHCMFHRQVLAANTSLSGLKQVLFLVIQAVTFIKSIALSSRIFTKLCFEMNTISSQLLLLIEC
jgi:hypothetical protein